MKDNLHQQLISAGAKDTEIDDLLAVAAGLKTVPAKQHRRSNPWLGFGPLSLTALAGIVIGMALVIFSQTVLPGSRFYAVQKLSDNLAISIGPGYRGTIMMKRAQQVKQLVASRASSSVVLAALNDYQAEAAAYKSVPANYSVFEYCRANLQQAASSAPVAERTAINRTLDSLQT